jgi:hypothetical protein
VGHDTDPAFCNRARQTTLIATDLKPARVVSEIESTLKVQLIVSTLIMTPVRPPFLADQQMCLAFKC